MPSLSSSVLKVTLHRFHPLPIRKLIIRWIRCDRFTNNPAEKNEPSLSWLANIVLFQPAVFPTALVSTHDDIEHDHRFQLHGAVPNLSSSERWDLVQLIQWWLTLISNVIQPTYSCKKRISAGVLCSQLCIWHAKMNKCYEQRVYSYMFLPMQTTKRVVDSVMWRRRKGMMNNVNDVWMHIWWQIENLGRYWSWMLHSC